MVPLSSLGIHPPSSTTTLDCRSHADELFVVPTEVIPGLGKRDLLEKPTLKQPNHRSIKPNMEGDPAAPTPQAPQNVDQPQSSHHLMFLPKDQWSPRYDKDTFYSFRIEGFEYMRSSPPPSSADAPVIPSKSSFPAYFYKVVVYRGHDKTVLLRRYSQFKWLYHQLLAHPPPPPVTGATSLPNLPPGTCPWDAQDDAFASCRQDELADFLTSMLELPGYAQHDAVVAFLEL